MTARRRAEAVRLEVPRLEPDDVFVERLADAARASRPSAAARRQLQGLRVGLVTAGVVGLTVGGAWAAGNLVEREDQAPGRTPATESNPPISPEHPRRRRPRRSRPLRRAPGVGPRGQGTTRADPIGRASAVTTVASTSAGPTSSRARAAVPTPTGVDLPAFRHPARPVRAPTDATRGPIRAGPRGLVADDELIARAKQGDPDAWRVLYRTHAGRLVVWLGTRPSGDSAAAPEDIAAEAWLVAAQKVADFTGSTSAFAGWLFGIARNLSDTTARRSVRRRTDPTEVGRDAGAPGRRRHHGGGRPRLGAAGPRRASAA